MGHIGLTPQSVHALGGFKVQGKTAEAARLLVADAEALVEAGCFSIVLECVPDEVARLVTEAVPVPTIGIGAGASCDGQVLVMHDLLGLEDRVTPKFVRRYAELKAAGTEAVAAFADDVRAGHFPGPDEGYHLAEGTAEELGLYGRGGRARACPRDLRIRRAFPRRAHQPSGPPDPLDPHVGPVRRRHARLVRHGGQPAR